MNLNYAYLETTSYCNLECTFCNRKEVIEGLKHMSLAEFDHVLAQLKRHDIKEAKLMGMGEPFMHPQFDQITARFKEVFPNVNLLSSTNGQIKLTDKMKAAMKNLDVCYISIDGGPVNFEKIRTGATWTKLIAYLEQIRDFRSECKTKFPINFTICPDNVYDIPAMLRLQELYNLDDIRLNFVQNWTEEESDIDLMNGFTAEQHEYLKQFKQYFKGKSPWTYSDCFWPKSGIYMTVDGNIKLCSVNTSAKPVGNIFKQPLELIYSSKAFTDIKQGCANNTPTEHCANCSYKELVPYLGKILE